MKFEILKLKNTLLFFALLFVGLPILQIKSQSLGDTTIVLGERYGAGSFHRLVFGSQWRDVWTTPVKIPVLDIKTFAGGLTPLERGGGRQTLSLHFKGNDGQYYKFRSVDKDPTSALPVEFKDSFVSDYAQDNISSSHPVAPLMVAPLLDSVGVINTKPYLYFMPKGVLPPEYDSVFGGIAGMIELNPEDSEDVIQIFSNALKITGTLRLIERLQEKKNEFVDSENFLKARLIDILTNDYDRHALQWKWAMFKSENKEIWKPVPKDRDRAFTIFNGFAPFLSTMIVPQYKSFSEDFSSVLFTTWAGRYLDRRFLIHLTKDDWIKTTDFVISKMTDETLDYAVSQQPPELFAVSGEKILRLLKIRRDKLAEFSLKFYEYVNSVAEIFGTEKDDSVFVDRVSDSVTSVKLFRLNKSGDHELKFSRDFFFCETEEIRIELGEGDDKAFVTGSVDNGILIRIAGNEGRDKFIDSSIVRGFLWGFLPVPVAEKKTRFYDSGKNSDFLSGNSTKTIRKEFIYPTDPLERLEPGQLYQGRDNGIYPVLDYSGNLGPVLGGGPMITNFDYRKVPFDSRYILTAAYAFNTGGYKIEFDGYFNSLIEGVTVRINAFRSLIDFTHFFGFGNETTFDKNLYDSQFYVIDQKIWALNSYIETPLSRFNKLRLGFDLRHNFTDEGSNYLIASAPFGYYGENDFNSLSFYAKYILDKRDHVFIPFNGYYFEAGGDFYPVLFSNQNEFGHAYFLMSGHLPFTLGNNFSLAATISGKKVFGKFPYYHSVYLGGEKALSGFMRDRFAGDASLFARGELSGEIANLKIFITGLYGFTLFAETGRVFANNEISDKWHQSYGAVLWVSFLQKIVNFSLTSAFSTESVAFYFGFKIDF